MLPLLFLFLTGLSLIKIKIILVVIAKFIEHLLCARRGTILHTLPNPNNELDMAVISIVQMKTLNQKIFR